MTACPIDLPVHHGGRWQRRHAATVHRIEVSPWLPPTRLVLVTAEDYRQDVLRYWRDRHAHKHRRQRQLWTVDRSGFSLRKSPVTS